MIDYKQKAFIIASLRRASYRWWARNECLKKARVDRGLYKCAHCQSIFPRKEVQIDHIEPVVPVTGFTTWDDYINRMFCQPEGFQVLCKDICHNVKTTIEKSARQLHKKSLTDSTKKATIKRRKRKSIK